jgi:hypothetical protein
MDGGDSNTYTVNLPTTCANGAVFTIYNYRTVSLTISRGSNSGNLIGPMINGFKNTYTLAQSRIITFVYFSNININLGPSGLFFGLTLT